MNTNERRSSDNDIQHPQPALLRETVLDSGRCSLGGPLGIRDAPLLDRSPLLRPFDDIMNYPHNTATPESTVVPALEMNESIRVQCDVAMARGICARCLNPIIQIALNILVFPASHYFFSTFRYVSSSIETHNMEDITSASSVVVVGPSHQFKTKMEEMIQTWDLIKIISLFFIGAAPVTLQIQPIYTSNITRVSVVASGLLACASLVCSYIYVLDRDHFLTRRSMDIKWKAASASGPIGEFWSLVALPLTFVLWSLFFFLVTMFYFIWGLAFAVIDDADAESKGVQYMNTLISALFVTALPIISFIKIYRAHQEIKGPSSN